MTGKQRGDPDESLINSRDQRGGLNYEAELRSGIVGWGSN